MKAISVAMANVLAASGLAAAVDPDRHTGEKLDHKTSNQPK